LSQQLKVLFLRADITAEDRFNPIKSKKNRQLYLHWFLQLLNQKLILSQVWVTEVKVKLVSELQNFNLFNLVKCFAIVCLVFDIEAIFKSIQTVVFCQVCLWLHLLAELSALVRFSPVLNRQLLFKWFCCLVGLGLLSQWTLRRRSVLLNDLLGDILRGTINLFNFHPLN
jgi:hypothetical protein